MSDVEPSFDSSTALIVVDMQNDFGHPDGSLFVTGGDEIADAINGYVAAARDAGGSVVYTQDWHPPETPHFATSGGVWPVHCVRDTWGAELMESVTLDGPVVRKGTGGEDGYSGFTMRDPESGAEAATELHQILQDQGVQSVVVVGLALDVCVRATADDAQRLGYDTTVVAAASAPVNLEPGDGHAAVTAMANNGITII